MAGRRGQGDAIEIRSVEHRRLMRLHDRQRRWRSLGQMRVVPVIIDWWEIRCCGRPFSLGDQVTWRLAWAADAWLPGELFVTLDANVETVPVTSLPHDDPAAARYYQRVIRSGPICADWGGTEPLSGRMALRGALLATWHGGGPEASAAPVTGFVRRIRTLRQRMQIGAGRRHAVVSGSELIDTTACPLEFDDSGDRADRGVVVDLEIVADGQRALG
ncbi:MAG: hypothetical protein JO242_01260 [Streptosporangiaceae bacterium]|nr:hypothetical protein [Streptosporangiaceae bacterium]